MNKLTEIHDNFNFNAPKNAVEIGAKALHFYKKSKTVECKST